MNRLVGVLAVLLVLVGTLSAQWEVIITTELGEAVDTLMFGVDPAATDGFDIGVDQSAPPTPPGGYMAYFPIDDPEYPYINRLRTDMRAPSDSIFWKILVDGSPESQNLVWNTAELPDSGNFRIGTAPTGEEIDTWQDMREISEFSFPTGQYVGLLYQAGEIPSPDTLPPYAINWSPEDGAVDVPVDATLEVDILDDGSGVDPASVTLTVTGIGDVPPEYYTLTAIENGYHLTADSPISLPPATEIEIILEASDNSHNQMSDTISFTTAGGTPTYTVSGNVYLEEETDHSGTIVTIIGDGVDTTDSEGAFEIADVPEGTQFISIVHEGYTPVVDTLDVTADITDLEYTLELIPTAITVSGTVELEGATDYSGSIVWVEWAGGTSDTATTDASGEYTITEVPIGTITVNAEHEGYISDMQTVEATDDVVVDFVLEQVPVETWTVSGHITLEGETDHSGTDVSLVSEEEEFNTTTDATGLFEFTEVPTGTYTLTAEHSGFETYTEELEVVSNVTDIDVELTAVTAELNPPRNVMASTGLTNMIEIEWAPPEMANPPGELVELSTDDGELDSITTESGSFSFLYYGSPGAAFANRFELPAPGCYLVGYKAYMKIPEAGSYLKIKAWSEVEGAPGSVLFPTWNVYGDSAAVMWLEEPMPNIPLEGEAFYIGFEETEHPLLTGIDSDDVDSATWVYAPDIGWGTLAGFGSPYDGLDFMLRALVVIPSGKVVELEPTPISASERWTGFNLTPGTDFALALQNTKPFSRKHKPGVTESEDRIHSRTVSTLSTMGLTGYKIYRSVSDFEDPEEAVLIAELSLSEMEEHTYIDTTDISAGIDYYYKVVAVYDEGESELSEVAIGTAVGMAEPAKILLLDWDDGDLLADNGTSEESDVLAMLLEEVGIFADSILVSGQNEHLDRYDITPENYEAIFIVTGAYPQDGSFTDEECDILSAYLEDGGKIYMEGVDNGWLYGNPEGSSDAALNFWYHFRVNWDFDGVGASEGNVDVLETNPDYFGANFSIAYDYQSTADHYVDELSSDGATIIMRSTSPPPTTSSGRMSFFEHPVRGYVAINSAVYIGAMNYPGYPGSFRGRILGSILNSMGIENTDVPEETASTPQQFSLSQNHPNPFNRATVLSFTLPKKTDISLTVHNLLGEKIATLAEGTYKAGTHRVNWQVPDGVPAGIYFYTLNYEEGSLTKKLLYLK